MLKRIIDKIEYLKRIKQLNDASRKFCIGHQVKLFNWSKPFEQDMWLIDFIEKRNLLNGNKKKKVALYSVFGPRWVTLFDNADVRLFVERENLHKPHFEGFLHRYLEDEKFSLSLGFDDIQHPQYMRFPFWLMWTVFPATVRFEDIKDFVAKANNIKPDSARSRFCAYVCSHDDLNRQRIFNEFNAIAPLSCPGRLFHNDDSLKTQFDDDKIKYLSCFKFNLTPENSDEPGYVTEKLFEAIGAHTVPIYNGSGNNPEPDIINHDAIVFIRLGRDNAEAVRFVEELNSSPSKYDEFSAQHRFLPKAEEAIWRYYEELENRLKVILKNI